MATTTYINYKSDDFGKPIRAKVCWSYENPMGSTEAGKPIVIILHMGGFMVGSAEVVPKPQVDYLTSNDFVVVIPNYRLSPQTSAWDGAFADVASALEWCQKSLPRELSDSHGVKVDTSRLVVMGHSAGASIALWLAAENPSLLKAVTAFYPSLYISEKSSSAHKPYTGFPSVPSFDTSAENMRTVFPEDEQASEAPLALPGQKPAPRNLWQVWHLQSGTWIEAVQPDGRFDLIDPCTKFAVAGKDWPPTLFVQGVIDDVPGCGPTLVGRAIKDLKAAGAADVQVEFVPDAIHGFDLPPMIGTSDKGPKWQAVLKGLDFLIKAVSL